MSLSHADSYFGRSLLSSLIIARNTDKIRTLGWQIYTCLSVSHNCVILTFLSKLDTSAPVLDTSTGSPAGSQVVRGTLTYHPSTPIKCGVTYPQPHKDAN